MSGGPKPETDILPIVHQLGPHFDYGVIDRMAKSGALAQLPPEQQAALQQIRTAGRYLMLKANTAPADQIGRGAFPAPPTSPAPTKGMRDYINAMIYNLPVLGQFAMMEVAWKEGGGTEQGYQAALQRQSGLREQWAQEFFHQFTAGIIKSPDISPDHEAAFNAIVKPSTSIVAMGVQGSMVFRGLGLISKVPKATTVLEQVPQRLRDIGMGAASFGVVDALRGDGIPEDPSALDPSGLLASKLAEVGIPDRIALGVSGATVGGVLGGALMGITRGFQWGREAKFAIQATPDQIAGMRQALQQLGVEVGPTASNLGVVRQYVKALQKVQNNESLAGLTSEILSREEWVAQALYSDAKIAQDSEEARYLVGLMRGQPGATSIAKGVTSPEGVREAAERLGLKVDVTAIVHEPGTPQATYDILISRPDHQYTAFNEASRQTRKATSVIQQVSKAAAKTIGAKQDNSLLILADGSVIRGGLEVKDVATKLKVQAPVIDGVARPDEGVKQIGQLLGMSIEEGGEKLVINLPSKLTQEQFAALGPAANVKKFGVVSLQTHDGRAIQLQNPFGQQIQDAVVELVKPVKTTSRMTPELVSQYKRTGVFNGQAAVLADGTPVTILNKAGPLYAVKDPITGNTVRVHPSKITPLQTSMEGEMAPSSMFVQYLSNEEQQALAKFRMGMLQGVDRPVRKFSELASFANSRGFTAQQYKGGAVELSRMTDREPIRFKDVQSAVQFVRKNTAPIPDFTPEEAKKILGFTAPGFMLPQGPPPSFGEMMPLRADRVAKMFEDNLGGRGPGSNLVVPMRGYFLDLDKKYGTTFFPLFNNIKERARSKSNFESSWFLGRGSEKLPDGVMPLKKIQEIAGKDANPEAITDWLEAGSDDARKALLSSGAITLEEARAATELRKWYNGLFTRYGIEADYVENYAPRVREAMQKYGTTDAKVINTYIQNDPLRPGKGADFWADNYRHGTLDVYDKDAWRVAQKYLSQGANNRFMKEPIGQAAEAVAKLAQINPQLAYPMGYFIQAVRGTEFWEQRVALSETMQNLIDALPGTVPSKTVTNTADQLVNFMQGSIYTATMGMRPSLAIRNVANSFMMSWPLYGGNKARYLESIGMALTENGVNQAIADGAIHLAQGPRFAAEEISEGLPKMFAQMSDFGFRLYDSADEFTRVQTYWAARLKAQSALDDFMAKAPNSSQARLETLKKNLVLDSGLGIQDPQVVEEFLRRAAVSPESAARYAGTQASDVVNFLYGRGMQPRWMRSLTGRMFGQFGTWSMWYTDYIRRSTTNLAKNGGTLAAGNFLARHALLNMAVLYAGKEALDLDMGKWMVYPAVAYSGGPGFELAQGVSTLVSGLGPLASETEGMDRYTRTKIAMGTEMIRQTLPAFVPFYYAGVDAIKVATADDPTVRLGALIAARPTEQHTAERRLQLLMGLVTPSFSTSSPVLTRLLNSAADGAPEGVDFEAILQNPQSGIPNQPTPSGQRGTGPAPAPPPTVPPAQPSFAPIRATVPPGVRYQNAGETKAPPPSAPIRDY